MSLKSSIIDGLSGKVLAAVAGATIIGGGTVVLKSSQTNAVQATEINAIREKQVATDEVLKSLDGVVRELDKNVAVLNERLKD